MIVHGGKFFFLAVLFFGVVSEAKIYTLKDESFASYLSFSTGTSGIKKEPFDGEYNATTSYSGGVTANNSLDFGFIYATHYLSWRFGFELMQPVTTSSDATDAAGAALYNVGTSISGYFPKVGLEINMYTGDGLRLYGFGFAGQASIDVKNTYTADSLTPGNFSNEYKGNCNATGGGLGMEFSGFDLSTIVVELGYRDMDFANLTYAANVTDFLGFHYGGDVVKTSAGASRDINMTGTYAALGFRFWLF